MLKNKINLDENRKKAIDKASDLAASGDKLAESLLKNIAKEIKNSFKVLKDREFTSRGSFDRKAYKSFVQECDNVCRTIELLAGLGVNVKI